MSSNSKIFKYDGTHYSAYKIQQHIFSKTIGYTPTIIKENGERIILINGNLHSTIRNGDIVEIQTLGAITVTKGELK